MREFSTRYLSLIQNEFKGLNLTRITDEEEFYYKQVEDSLIPFKEGERARELLDETGLLVDIGFGGGFPLLPLGVSYPNITFRGFEARKKKVDAVNFIAKDMNAPNTRAFHERVENILFDKDAVVTLKAVGKVQDFLPRINTKNKVKVYVVFYKGPNFSQLEDISKLKGWKLIHEKEFDLPFTEKRKILIFENTNVPHGTKSSAQLNLVNLSDFI